MKTQKTKASSYSAVGKKLTGTEMIIYYCLTGGLVAKLQLSIIFGLVFSPIIKLFEQYVFADWKFAGFVLVAIAIDTALGAYNALIRQDLSSGAFAKIFHKIIIYSAILSLTHILTNFQVQGAPNNLFLWFAYFAYSAILVREGISIVEKCAKINPRIVPKRILAKLRDFDETGNFVPKNAPKKKHAHRKG
jgi:phage-related holin